MKKGDCVMLGLFAVLLAATLFTYVYIRGASVPAVRIATISVNGQIVDTLYLDKLKAPFRRVYKSAAGFNAVYVDSDGAAIVGADCPDQYCVRTGRISTPGVSSICLPHRFILRISGQDDSGLGDELDGGTY